MLAHTQMVSTIGCGSGEVVIIISILNLWTVVHTTLVPLQIGVFDLPRWQIVQ